MEKDKDFLVILGRNIEISPYQDYYTIILYVQAEMLISDDIQKFCVLECSGCKEKKCTKYKKQFDCAKCTFQIYLIDESGSIIVFISGDPAGKTLSMRAYDICNTICIKVTSYLYVSVRAQQMLSNRLFYIELRKSS
ncbi:hypothetical protein H5410_047064 [Solanum commersonii]|uniref:Replication factor A C-terminal domain-containing protein n=1 Tax=Solanum commersonii TaxID=4109 RepID=A0A9J5XHK2_SOLCO|nr:hypothetical protein H5410_047064 [Solanum commersonii]